VCGIAGIVDLAAREFPDVDAILGCLRHRGPDSTGTFVRPGAAIGQTRLAVIDLVTGDPPITNEDGTVGVVFNGEIYNYQSVRQDLLRSGHDLKTAGDTEVIAHLAEDMGAVELALRLDGMFAFAVWDDTRRRLVLGRDRFGKKPLYYWTDGQQLVFGSEIKSVVAAPCVPRRLEPRALPAYLTFGYVPTPCTFFEGVHSLPPGHVLTFDASGVVVEPYWQPLVPGISGARTVDLRGEELRREVRRRLCDAVERRLIADVPLGAFLSGGVDSSSVVALMARLSPRRVRTFTIGFDDQDLYDERPYAARVARLYGTEHTEFVVDPDRAELIDRLVWHHDQPFGDSSALPTFLLSELTRRHVTVALCGDGGDELFGGYERFAAALALDRFDRLPSGLRRSVVRGVEGIPPSVLGGRGASARRALSRAGVGLPDAYLSWLSFVDSSWRERLLGDGADGWGIDDYRRIWAESEGADLLDRLVLLNMRTYLLDDLLPKVDRASMAHGLEVRSPFLDADLAELALRLPPRGRVWGLSLKRVLKDAVRDLLPREILHRRKRGFGVPLDRWFRTDLASYVQGTLCSSQSRVAHHLDATAVTDLVTEHQAGTANHGHALWTLLTLEVFLRNHDW
jgi:asparagine synthase (glutamine-hydrolysing)